MIKAKTKKCKRLIAMLMAVMMVFTTMPMTSMTANAVTTNEDGYIEVSTIEDLYNIRDDLSANYILMNDIDLTEATAENGDWSYGGRGWNPIGSNDKYRDSAFTGVFDGNGYSIIGMNISINRNNALAGSYNYIGLFAENAGVIRNLKMQSVNLNVTGDDDGQDFCVGAICSLNTGTISECIIEGQINVAITREQGDLSDVSRVGGITGIHSRGIIEKCYNNALICGIAGQFGGIAGKSMGTIQNCYNTGDITGKESDIGGIVGRFEGRVSSESYAKILNCYNVGNITSGTSRGYGIAKPFSPATIENAYYLNRNGIGFSGATDLSEANMKLRSMYRYFDFETIWTMGGDPDYPYPELQCFIEGDSATTVDKVINSQGYIEIRTIEDLYSIRDDLTANYILMNDIDLTEATAENGEWSFGDRGWHPIGSGEFTGVFDGNGYSIIGMNISFDYNNVPYLSGGRYIGLFAQNAGVIRDLKMKGVNLNISDIFSRANTRYIGAICGVNTGTISECIVEGQIKASNCDGLGGITGFNSKNGIIEKCYNNSLICGESDGYLCHVGGIAGISEATIQNCYNAVDIIGPAYTTGGIQCGNWISSNTKTRNCYNVGYIASGKGQGISYTFDDVTNENTYILSGTGSKGTGDTILTDGQMKQQSMYSNFDFETVWTMGGDADYPYPELQCFSLSGVLGIKGDCIVLSTVMVDISQIKKVDDTFTYEWFVNGSSVGTGTSYTIKEADAGKELSVKVVGTKEYNKGTIYSEKIIIEPDSVPGDVNDDGKINSLDGLLLMRYLNGWNVDIASPEAMDVNADGKVNSLDGLILMRYLNGWNVTLG